MRTTMRKALLRGAATIGGLAASLVLATTASATATALTAPNQADLTSALAAAHTPQAATLAAQNLHSVAHASVEQAREVRVADQAVPVFGLSAAFVRGDQVAVGTLAYIAVPATSSVGAVTVQSVRDRAGTGWHAASAASGTVERDLAATLPGGVQLLTEPQVGAWYAATADRVTLLSAAFPALKSQVGRSWSLADYQALVHTRYADKQAGSDYARQHKVGGGYNYDGTVDPALAQAMLSRNEEPVSGGDNLLVLALGASSLGLGLAGVLILRRRRPSGRSDG
ncbi:hypothetical protein F0L68_01335 [Solihabitans fulvus]|uniref:LPXTG-motif cell wall anchor domain-containing protein n=1 Tax=Solihabitans fulvus TaxID=1892852 RepID=A0A5B2XWC0_9PSEU|nr:hypothetical protein [Solihabitans fulvus]KAA2267192.1 hypothetical protein F0L68_01335 [Solihabitans fulvus]